MEDIYRNTDGEIASYKEYSIRKMRVLISVVRILAMWVCYCLSMLRWLLRIVPALSVDEIRN